MEMIAHDPAAAKRAGVPQSVGKEFSAADHARALHEKGKAMARRVKK